ncbi:MAG TPA: hypothetical protein VF533_06145 [Solirubrobacteraceae bacterium]|jgi:hypothetical protein
MATTTTTDLIAASRALDPAGRALLNLWLHRGLDDAAIAQLSGGSAADVAERRRQVVERLAGEVGDTPEAVRAALDDLAVGRPATPSAPTSRPAPSAPEPVATSEHLVLPGTPEATGSPDDLVLPGEPEPAEAGTPEDLVVPGEPEPATVGAPEDLVVPGETEPAQAGAPEDLVVLGDPDPDPDPDPEPDPAAARRPSSEFRTRRPARGRSPIPATLGVALGLVVGGTVLAAAISGGGDKGGEPRATATPSATATPTPTATPAAARPQPLTAVPGGPGEVEGTLTAQDGRLTLDVKGLDRPPKDYEVWLYNSLADARPLGTLATKRFALPKNADRFTYLDVSLEGDRNRNHSGRSVLRAELPR